MSQSMTARHGRGRRPSADVRAGVLAAAARLLFDEGVQAITFDRVAREAGSSKMTLYKWWPSPGSLAAEAYYESTEETLEFPDTGDLRADLISQLQSFIQLLSMGGAGNPVSQLIGAAQLDRNLASSWSEKYALPRRELAVTRLHAAQRLGQLRPDADLEVIVDQLWGACYHRLLVLKVPLETVLAERLVDHALDGAAATR